jgi:hypothetical protein
MTFTVDNFTRPLQVGFLYVLNKNLRIVLDMVNTGFMRSLEPAVMMVLWKPKLEEETKMKKKLVMMGAGLAVGSMLLMTAVYAGIGETPGYDAYKSAIKQTAAVNNVTEKVKFSVEDNGKVLLQVDVSAKSNKEAKTGSADITLKSGTTEHAIQLFHQEDKAILKTDLSDTYQIVEPGKVNSERVRAHKAYTEHRDPAFAQELEKVLDSLVGNLKNDVTLNEVGTGKEVALHLEGTQIPAVVNTIGSLLIKASGFDHGEELQFNNDDTLGIRIDDMIKSLPKLTDDIAIDAVSLNAKVNADNLITNQIASIEISGKDSQGAAHEVTVKFEVSLSEFDHTTPDTIDLTGEKVETIKLSE